MSEKSIIIIGGGIAGLSAGCYGQMNGFRTRIFEMHKKKPGGLCTSWKRQGYTVDGCIHWLVGSGPNSELYTMWQELGALEGKTIINQEEYIRVEGPEGKQLIVYTDLDRLEKHMKELAPEDAAIINEFIAAARQCTRFEPPIEKAPEVSGLFDLAKVAVKHFSLLRMLRKWNRISLREYAGRFKNPTLREAFPLFFLPDFPVSFLLMTFAWMHKKAAGYPVGGSLEFSRGIEKRYLSLGGEINYKAKVVRILTENNRAVGIRLEDGAEHHADYVVSAADGRNTIFEMLEGKFLDETIKGYYEKLQPFPALVYVAFGVNRAFDEIHPSVSGITIRLREPMLIGNQEHIHIGVRLHNFDPTLAPEGRTLVTVMLTTDFEYWKKLREDDERYKAEKERIAGALIAILDKRFPGFASQVEMHDVASPTTFVRYTGNWKGSFEGWQVTPGTWSFGKRMKKTLPGLDNFYMAGHWVEPGGGLPVAALSGRNVIQIICKNGKKKFATMR
ncbi:MAG TPA: NAD(P)/FAD-dependent oxidoreductase [Nitrospirota bacterium]|nr:NAD(P)/FAD-dependent oxidoreductase [Nitrospirota bacterium]